MRTDYGKSSNQALQATPNGAVSSAVADGAFWFGVPELSRWAAAMRMRKIRQLFLMIGLISALPVGAHAQWATSRITHDWRVTIAGNSYGLTQEFFSTWSTVHGTTTTTMYFGQQTLHTRLPAVCVAALALAFVGAVPFFLFAMLPRKHEDVPPNPMSCSARPSRCACHRGLPPAG